MSQFNTTPLSYTGAEFTESEKEQFRNGWGVAKQGDASAVFTGNVITTISDSYLFAVKDNTGLPKDFSYANLKLAINSDVVSVVEAKADANAAEIVSVKSDIQDVISDVGNNTAEIDTLKATKNGYIPQGEISVAADFPSPTAVQAGWLYYVKSAVTDNDATKTNTGLSFPAGVSIVWSVDGSWIDLGSNYVTSDLMLKLTNGANYYGTITTSSTTIANPSDGAMVLPTEDGVYPYFDSIEKYSELCVFQYNGTSWVKIQLAKILHDSIFDKSSELSGVAKVDDILITSIKDLVLNGDFGNKYFYIWGLKIDNVVSNDFQLFFALSDTKNGNTTTDDLILKITLSQLSTKTGREWISMPDDYSKGFTGKILIDWEEINKFSVNYSSQWKTYHKGGVKIKLYNVELPKIISDENTIERGLTNTSIDSSGVKLHDNIIYPIDENYSHSVSDNFLKNALLDVKIVNGLVGSKYQLKWVGNQHPTLKDQISINRVDEKTGAFIGYVFRGLTWELDIDRTRPVTIELSANTVDTSIYTECNISNGLQIFLTIDYSKFTEFWYGIDNDNNIHDNCILSRFDPDKKIEDTKQNFVSYDGVEDLYIGAKYNSSKDIVTYWRKCMFNELYTFYDVMLKTNTNSIVDSNVKRPYSDLLLRATSDNIGPILLSDGWVGANHYYEVEGTQYKTANNIYYKIIVDGLEINNKFEGYANEVVIEVKNEIYVPSALPAQTIQLYEYVSYKVIGNSIDVIVRHEWVTSNTIDTYYGMQSMPASWQETVYFSHGEIKNIQDINLTILNSGPSATYKCEKYVLAKADKSICQSLLYDTQNGLGSTWDTNILETSNRAFVSSQTKKSYFRSIENKAMTPGESYYWHGVYSWFDNSTQNDADLLFSSDINFLGKKMIFADFASAKNYKIPTKSRNNELELYSKDISVSFSDIIQPNGVDVTTNGYGNIYVLAK